MMRTASPRRALLAVAILALLAAPGCGTREPERRPNGWNVVFVLVDALRADHLQIYGYERDTSPNLARFASGAAVFDAALAQAPWTLSSVSSILSSMYPQTHGVTHAEARRPLPESIRTLPEALAESGYLSAAFVANGLVNPLSGLAQGFDWFEVIPAKHAGDRHGDSAANLNAEAIPWLETTVRQSANPFFLYLHYMDPHDPYDDPEGYHRRYDPDYAGSFDGGIYPVFRAMAKKQAWSLDPRDLQNMVARYDGEIRYVDAKIEEVLRAIDRLGVADRTVVIFTADHGEQFLDHGSLKHATSVYQEEVHVPLVIRAPGIQAAGRRIATPVELIDLYPTIFELLGLPDPPNTCGRSLVPLLEGRGAPARPYDVFTETSHGWIWDGDRVAQNKVPYFAVVRGKRKLICREGKRELYDLADDPGETRDLAKEKTPEADELETVVRAWRELTASKLVAGVQYTPKEMAEQKEQLIRLGYLPEEADTSGDAKPPGSEDDHGDGF